MNEEDAEPQQDGAEEVLLQSAQQMFEKLRTLVSTKKEKLSKNLLSSIKKKIDLMYDDVHNNLNDDLPNTSSCVDASVGDSQVETEPESRETPENVEASAGGTSTVTAEEFEIKTEPDACLIGSIKVKNLSLLLDPNRPKPALDVSSITISSDSEDDVLVGQSAKKTNEGDRCTDSNSVKHIAGSSSKHSAGKQTVPASDSDRLAHNTPNASRTNSRKSILKGSPLKPSAHKNVQFAKGDPAVHTYPYVPPVSSSSSASGSESNSDEEFNAKPKHKKKARTKAAQSKAKPVQFDEQIRSDKKYFSKCVVNVQRVSPVRIAHLIAKRREDESRTPETTRVDDMGGLKRKRGTRKDSSDSDQPTVEEKKKKRKLRKANSKDSDDSGDEEHDTSKAKNGDDKNDNDGENNVEAHSSQDKRKKKNKSRKVKHGDESGEDDTETSKDKNGEAKNDEDKKKKKKSRRVKDGDESGEEECETSKDKNGDANNDEDKKKTKKSRKVKGGEDSGEEESITSKDKNGDAKNDEDTKMKKAQKVSSKDSDDSAEEESETSTAKNGDAKNDTNEGNNEEAHSSQDKSKSHKVSVNESDASGGEDAETSKSTKNGNEEEINTEANSSYDHQDLADHENDTDDDHFPLLLEPETILRASSDSEPETKTSKPMPKSKKKNRKSSSGSSDSEAEKMPAKSRKKRARGKRVLSDSDASASDTASKAKNASTDDSEDEETQKPKKTKKRSRIKKVADSSDEEEKLTRKQLRKVISRDSLADTTKQAERDEAARKARIAERQERYNNIFDSTKLENSQQSKVVLDFNEETQEELLSVDYSLVKHLKPHQGKGIQFMWDACFESLDRTKSTKGSGCILAHCMGLGKTLQVITLCHTLLKNTDKTGVKKVLVVCPLSTVLNWVAEFKKWLPDDDEVEVYNLVSLKQNSGRAMCTLDWHRNGGVMVLGYDMFRNLSNEGNKRVAKKMRNDFQRSLVDPGADLVVCDEGHLLKNEKTTLSKAMNRIKSLRRIVLTGTPLQNNLKEYYCMVQFVKPNLLGTYKEYLNRFVNPITNGQYTDSTQNDISIMRRRSHVLHKLLDGTVQRRDYCVLAPFLPPKHEYIIFVSLTQVQRGLYQHYLANFAQRSSGARTSFLFTDFQELQRICTHPRVLLDKSIQNKAKAEKNWDDEEEEDSEGSLKDFIDDDADTASSSGSSNESSNGDGGGGGSAAKAAAAPRRRTRATADKFSEPEEEEEAAPVHDEWWRQFTQTDELDNIMHSGKLALLFEILHQCELIGDKVLVFSQSLLSLNIIEYFLGKIDEASQDGDSSMVKGYASSWSLGADYFRLDGSSSCDNRAAWCKTFNDPSNTRARLFLISTRAGGLGINLVAANRVIIFDVSWNPSHDIQSIYRVYRFGQTKPSYIYRFVTLGTMEMKVYERQVTKQAISKRVIDEQQIDRHYNQHDLQELYKFEPEPSDRPLPAPPKDILLGELLQSYTDIIFKYHEHQSLLENKEDEVLNEAERKAAWDEFENEKKMQRNTAGTINNIPMHTVVQALTSIIRREHPGVTQLEINGVMPQLVNQLREQLAAGEMAPFNKMLAEIRTIKAAEQARNQEYYKSQQQALWLAQQMQMQFPGLSTADAERILRTQMNQMQQQAAGGAGPLPRAEAPRILNPNDVVNLDED